MIERGGDIWSIWKKPNQLILITTNNTISHLGHLIMGKGIALEAKIKIPELPKLMGLIAQESSNDYLLRIFPEYGIGCLQTKRNWKDPSPIQLVTQSIDKLRMVSEIIPSIIFNLPRPGCGNGGLNWEKQVKPLCVNLPNNCVIWSKE